ncbi:YqaJ viral recombinase family protein [Acetobacterium carbinolicum]|uniref:YqaJ viral recombinase family nuclease n=1 Tax=Acetobacterium carbinolicum TaxID=52690 RepID=UPI0039BFA5CB
MLDHNQWLEARRKGIGGSDAAAIIGLNPWATPYTVWADKTGRIPPKEDNEIMRQGRDLEQYVADRWMQETGKKCRRKTKMLRCSDYPFALANVDRWVVGENAGLECKTTSIMNLKKFKGGEFPETYYCQCVHYMAVTGAERWYLGVLVLSQGFHTFVIERDEDEIQALMDAERDFWKYVELDAPPPVDGLDPTTGAINTIYAGDTEDGIIEIYGKENTVNQYLTIKQRIKELDIEKERIEQQLKEELQLYEKGICGSYQINWKGQKRRTFQVKDFAKDHPEIDLDRYFKTSEFRKFEIKEAK